MHPTPLRSAFLALAVLVPGQALLAVTKPEQNKVRVTLGAKAAYPMLITLVSGRGAGEDAITPNDDKPAMKAPLSSYFLPQGKTVELTFACNVPGDGAEYVIKISEFRGNAGGDPYWVQFAAAKPADSGGLAALRWLTLTPTFAPGTFALPASVTAPQKAQLTAMFKTSSPTSKEPSTLDLGAGFTAAPSK